MKNKPNSITPLIVSFPTETISKRFLTKVSKFDNGKDKLSIMIAVVDMLESGFTIKFFSNEEEAASLLNLLKSA